VDAKATAIVTELLTIRAADGRPLDGVRYTRAGEERPAAARTAVNFLHGRSMNFYVGVQRFAAEAVVRAGYDVLVMNRRSAGVAAIRDTFDGVGDAWTLWREHQMDVDAGVLHLRGLGYRRLVMAGHSLGGLLAADYAARDAEVAGLILASPSSTFRGLPTTFPEGERARVIEQARQMVAEGRRRELILLPAWTWIITAEAVVDPLAPGATAPLDEVLARYEGPLLTFCGDQGGDGKLLPGAHAAFDRSPSPAKHLEILAGCDHFYVGFEARVTGLIRDWLAKHVPAA
jgi:pimeloyl-ACP methyl ester carboxylesterase